MKTLTAAALALALWSGSAAAEEKKPPLTLSQIVTRQAGIAEKDLVPLIEAMPEEKLDFAPAGEGFAGVRTFRQQVVHITGTLRFVATALLGEPMPTEAEQEVAPANVKSKSELVAWVKATFEQVRKALAKVDEKNFNEVVGSAEYRSTRLGLAGMAAWHTMDHYGQLVGYARANGVVPPASRPAPKK
jgi:hypothetical protein